MSKSSGIEAKPKHIENKRPKLGPIDKNEDVFKMKKKLISMMLMKA